MQQQNENSMIVWVGVPVPKHVLQHFLEFDDPAAEMARVLSEVPTLLEPVEGGSNEVYSDEAPIEEEGGSTADPIDLRNPFDHIRAALKDVNKRAGGYGSIKLAAEVAYRHFGSAWLESDPSSPGYATREKIRKILWDALSDSHTNKSMPWRRFQNFAADYGKVRFDQDY